jgi:hypothetical protein
LLLDQVFFPLGHKANAEEIQAEKVEPYPFHLQHSSREAQEWIFNNILRGDQGRKKERIRSLKKKLITFLTSNFEKINLDDHETRTDGIGDHTSEKKNDHISDIKFKTYKV